MLMLEVVVVSSQSRCFPYEKSIVINALYDVIESLGLSLDSANSMRGTLIVSDTEYKVKMRIAINFGADTNQTQVMVFSELGFTRSWSPIILDELEGRMKRVYQLKRGEITI